MWPVAGGKKERKIVSGKGSVYLFAYETKPPRKGEKKKRNKGEKGKGQGPVRFYTHIKTSRDVRGTRQGGGQGKIRKNKEKGKRSRLKPRKL